MVTHDTGSLEAGGLISSTRLVCPSPKKASGHNIKLPLQIKSATPYLECYIQAV